MRYDFPHPKSIILIGFFSASLFSPSTASSFTISSMNSKNLFICLNLSYIALCTAPLLAITPMSASGGMTVPSARMYFFFRFCDSTAFGAVVQARLPVSRLPFFVSFAVNSRSPFHALTCVYPSKSEHMRIAASFFSQYSWNACFSVSLSMKYWPFTSENVLFLYRFSPRGPLSTILCTPQEIICFANSLILSIFSSSKVAFSRGAPACFTHGMNSPLIIILYHLTPKIASGRRIILRQTLRIPSFLPKKRLMLLTFGG